MESPVFALDASSAPLPYDASVEIAAVTPSSVGLLSVGPFLASV